MTSAHHLSHAPEDYECPLCEVLAGRTITLGGLGFGPDAVIRHDADVAILLNPLWWPGTQGSLLVVPTSHYENVYDFPVALATGLYTAIRDAAVALRAAQPCSGITVRQNNEPAGDQEVWHFHVHVMPREPVDGLALPRPDLAPPRAFGERSRRLEELMRRGERARPRTNASPVTDHLEDEADA